MPRRVYHRPAGKSRIFSSLPSVLLTLSTSEVLVNFPGVVRLEEMGSEKVLGVVPYLKDETAK